MYATGRDTASAWPCSEHKQVNLRYQLTRTVEFPSRATTIWLNIPVWRVRDVSDPFYWNG